MSDYEKIDDHKYLDGDDDVGNSVCNANGPLADSGQIGSEDSTAVPLCIVQMKAWTMENHAKEYDSSLE